MHLSGDAARERAINHAVQRMAVNVGPGFLTVDVVPTNGTTITLSDFYGQLAYALSMRADSKEVANAVQLGFMLGGSIVIESVFSLPGLGHLAWESISKNDFPVVQAVVLILALVYIGLTFAADMLNAVLDPRLRAA